MALAVVENGGVVGLGRLEKVLLEAQPQVPPAILVVLGISSHRKDTTWLAFYARPCERGDRQRPVMCRRQCRQVRPDVVEKAQVLWGEEDVLVGHLDEPTPAAVVGKQLGAVVLGELRRRVLDRGLANAEGEIEKVVRHHPLAHALQEIGHAAAPRKGRLTPASVDKVQKVSPGSDADVLES